MVYITFIVTMTNSSLHIALKVYSSLAFLISILGFLDLSYEFAYFIDVGHISALFFL